MSAPTGAANDETALVAAQIGRPPRSPWRVAVRCEHGFPQVIVSPSLLEDGTPFPTVFWLTCPALVRAVDDAESESGTDAWALRLATDVGLAERAIEADVAYRFARTAESGGTDACEHTGVAGMRHPLRVKCLHAHVAAYLAGTGDPVGEGVLMDVALECDGVRCAKLARCLKEETA